MTSNRILVTGANGQLGKELQDISPNYPDYEFIFLTRQELPVDDAARVKETFNKWKPSYCINCAAYTAVDKAETDKEIAFLINSNAPGLIAKACVLYQSKLIHVSTDYVFDGKGVTPYKEDHPTNPINIYGLSKLKGEVLCLLNHPDAIIIRTAWVYSVHGNNFVKTMRRLMKERPEIKVVSDQVGAPTYAADLAEVIIDIISHPEWVPGIYHYSNSGKTNWYEFAEAIRKFSNYACKVIPILTDQYPTPAKRPGFSLLDTEKIRRTFGITIREWDARLGSCLQKIDKLEISN